MRYHRDIIILYKVNSLYYQQIFDRVIVEICLYFAIKATQNRHCKYIYYISLQEIQKLY